MSNSAAESAVAGDDAAVPAGNSFHLEWSNHLPNMQAVLEALYCHQSLVDVTLACSDGTLKAHKVILSACSPYFESLFRDVPCKHPVLVLRGVSVREMRALLRFMYRGQVDVPERELSALVATACEFKVKGFAVDAMKASGPHPSSKQRPASDDEDDEDVEDEDENELEIEPVMVPADVKLSASSGRSCSPAGSQPGADGPPSTTEAEQAGSTGRQEASPVALLQPPPDDALPSSAEPPAPAQAQLPELPRIKQEVLQPEDAEEADADADMAAQAIALAKHTAAASDASSDPAPSAPGEPATRTGDAPPTASTSCDPSPAPDPPSIAAPTPTASAAADPAASPYRRETRYKGQKRVDVGLRPAGRTRSQDKREDPASLFAGAASSAPRTSSAPSAGPPPKKFRSSGIVLTPVPPPSSHGRTGAPSPVPGPASGPTPAQDGHLIVGSGTLILPSELMVKVKEEAESAEEEEELDEEEEEEEATTADMFCIPHLSPDSDMREEEGDSGLVLGQLPPQHGGPRRAAAAPSEEAEGTGDMACPYCFTRCPRFSDLKRHMRQHTEDKPHECEFCSLAFARASHLQRHRRTHTGERPFRCAAPTCERSFSRQDKLKLHMQRAHPGLMNLLAASDLVPGLGQRGRRRKDRGGLGSVRPGPSASRAVISLPFGDTSYLTSLSLGQQRYNDLTISPVPGPGVPPGALGRAGGGGGGGGAQAAEELLKGVRQLGECTIQTLPGKVMD